MGLQQIWRIEKIFEKCLLAAETQAAPRFVALEGDRQRNRGGIACVQMPNKHEIAASRLRQAYQSGALSPLRDLLDQIDADGAYGSGATADSQAYRSTG